MRSILMAKKYLQVEPPAGLFNKVMGRIEREERLLSLKRRIFAFSVGLASCLSVSAYSFNLAQDTFGASGFKEYFSLIFSDTTLVFNYWQSFFMSLLESFPAMEAAFFLGAALGVLQLFKILIKEIKNIRILQATYGFK